MSGKSQFKTSMKEKKFKEDFDSNYSIIKPTFLEDDLRKADKEETKKLTEESTEEQSDKEKKEEKAPRLSIIQLFRYSTFFEKLLIFIGCISGAIGGLAMPAVIILFGRITNNFVYHNIKNHTDFNLTSSNGLSNNTNFNGSYQIVDNSSFINVTQFPLVEPNNILSNDSAIEKKNHLDSIPFDRFNFNFMEEVHFFGSGMLIIGSLQFIFGYLMVLCLNTAAERQVLRIRQLFLRAVLRQDISWFDTHSSGDFASRSAEDLNKLQDGIGEKIGMCALFTSTFISSMIVAFVYGWKLTLVILSVMPVLMVATAIFSKIQTSLTDEELKAYSKAGAIAEEVFNSIRTVAAFGGEQKEIERYKFNLKDANASGKKRGLISGIGQAMSWFIIYGSYSVAFWYGVRLIIESYSQATYEYDPSTLVIVFFSALMGSMNIGQASPYIEALSIARAAAATIYSIIERKPPIDNMSIHGRRPRILVGNIDFEEIDFAYPSRPDVTILKGFNLKIRSGETVALVGSSGCGKSTLIQLVQRFYDPLEGRVKLDGSDIKTLNVQWLRQQIGIVGQEPSLFAFTIKENIRLGKEGASDEDIEAAAKAANAHDFISKLPKKYDTMLGENGAQLSGGQKQRIAIARALIKNPRILLLDEATSALDCQSEAKVQEALDKARIGRTTLIVAHRLATIRNADRIIVINKGSIAEIGTHNQLMENKGLYYQMVNAQTNQEDSEEPEEVIHAPVFRALSSADSQLGYHEAPIEFQMTNKIEEELPDVSLWPILKLNLKEWPYIALGSFGAFGLGFNTPCYALLFGEIMGVLSITDPDKATEESIFYSCLFLLVGVWAGVCTFLQIYMFSVAGEYLTMRLRELTFSAIVHQDIEWFDRPENGTGTLCSRLATDASNVQGATGSRIGILLQTVGSLTTALVLSLVLVWKQALVSAVFVPLVFIATYFQGKIMMNQASYALKAQEEAAKSSCEAISNIRTVASLCKEEMFCGLHMESLIKSQRNIIRQRHFRGFLFGFAQSIPMLSYGISLWYGGYLIEVENVHYEDVFKVSELLIFGAMMVGQAIAFAPNYNKGILSAARIFRLLNRKPVIDSHTSTGVILRKDVKPTIEFEHVEFAYPTRPQVKVLQKLSLKINEGLTVALVGSSGCGKSTCIQLLERFYDPADGTVLYGGENIRFMNVHWLRSQIGLVSQEPVLFDYSIKDNIAYGDNDREVSMEEIIGAAKDANIHNFITSLPQGYLTRVGSKGTQLSGGQKQRVAIARALIRNPKILLLDEATSALDTESEKLVQEALNQAMCGRTCIVIAHRLSTIQKANLIIVLHHGRIAEVGTHSQLLAKKGLYFKLHSTAFQK